MDPPYPFLLFGWLVLQTEVFQTVQIQLFTILTQHTADGKRWYSHRVLMLNVTDGG